MSDALLQVEDATFRYEGSDWTLGGVSFSLRAGEVLAIIGPNGSGKSTLLRLAAGVLAPHSGRVCLAGRDMAATDRREIARTLGYLPQNIPYAFDYAVEEVVSMGRFPHLEGLGFLTAADHRVVDESLRKTETLPFRGRSLSRLSGGERQRVFLASVLAQEPRVLLLDEPTASLDIHHQAQFFRLLRRLAGEGIAVAVVTHDLNVASFYCTRLLLMRNGARACEGDAEAVLRQDILSAVYGEALTVQRDAAGRPIVLPAAQIDIPRTTANDDRGEAAHRPAGQA
jgi:iron complex transport system ATP-binding protein